MPITINGSGTFAGISVGGLPDGCITNSDIGMTGSRILGRSTSTAGNAEELTAGTGLVLSGGALTSPGVSLFLATQFV